MWTAIRDRVRELTANVESPAARRELVAIANAVLAYRRSIRSLGRYDAPPCRRPTLTLVP